MSAPTIKPSFSAKSLRAMLLLMCTLVCTCLAEQDTVNLVPTGPSTAPNYWCTWYWQNYLIEGGKPVENPSAGEVFSNQAAREFMTYENILGPNGMARVMLPDSRSEYWFLIDHGWQDKSIEENTFFTFVMDTRSSPRLGATSLASQPQPSWHATWLCREFPARASRPTS